MAKIEVYPDDTDAACWHKSFRALVHECEKFGFKVDFPTHGHVRLILPSSTTICGACGRRNALIHQCLECNAKLTGSTHGG